MKIKKQLRWVLITVAALVVFAAAGIALGRPEGHIEDVSPPLIASAAPADLAREAGTDTNTNIVVRQSDESVGRSAGRVTNVFATIMQEYCFYSRAAVVRDSGFLQPVGAGNVLENDGFRLEITHVAVIGHEFFIFSTFENLDGRHNIDNSSIPISVWSDSDGGMVALRVFEQVGGGVSLLFGYANLGRLITSQEITLQMHGGFGLNNAMAELYIDFDLGTALTQIPFDRLYDTPLLQPHLHNIEIIAPEDFWMPEIVHSISSIGILGGRLHVQEKFDPRPHADSSETGSFSSSLWLRGPQGNYVFPLYHQYYHEPTASLIGLHLGENGRFSRLNPFFNWPHPYRRLYGETVFEVDLDRLSEYQLAVRYWSQNTVVFGMWELALEVDSVPDETALVASELDVNLECCGVDIRYALVTPFDILLRGDAVLSSSDIFDDIFESWEAEVNLYDNGVLTAVRAVLREAGRSYLSWLDNFSASFIIDTDAAPIDLDSVVSIEIAGETILFRQPMSTG